MSLLAGEVDAKLVVTSFLENIITSKNRRRLQTLSIRHCVDRRLRDAFNALKLLLTPQKKQSVRDWYRCQVLSKVFGCWVAYVCEEQSIDLQLSLKSHSCFKGSSLRRFRSKTAELSVASTRAARKLLLARNYYSCLRLLESFESIRERIDKNVLTRVKYDAGKQLQQKKQKTKALAAWITRDHFLYRCAVLNEKADMKKRNSNLKKSLSRWREHTQKQKTGHDIDTVCTNKYEGGNGIWAIIIIRRALAAFARFSAKKRRYDRLESTYNRHTQLDSTYKNTCNVRTSGDRNTHSLTISRSTLEGDIIATSSKRQAILQWIQAVRRRLHTTPRLPLAVSHFSSTGYFLRVSRVLTRIQAMQKRSFIGRRRFAFSILSHTHKLLSKGLKAFIAYRESTREKNSKRMMGSFKYEIRRFSNGLSVLRERSELRMFLKHSIVKAVVIWKVRRHVVAVRRWNEWVLRKTERRRMLLQARGDGQRGIKMRACRLWLTTAATVIKHDQHVRTRGIVVRVARKWRAFVYRNRLRRQRESEYGYHPTQGARVKTLLRDADNGHDTPLTHSVTLNAPSTSSSSNTTRNNDNRRNNESGRKNDSGRDLLRAKPRVLEAEWLSPQLKPSSPFAYKRSALRSTYPVYTPHTPHTPDIPHGQHAPQSNPVTPASHQSKHSTPTNLSYTPVPAQPTHPTHPVLVQSVIRPASGSLSGSTRTYGTSVRAITAPSSSSPDINCSRSILKEVNRDIDVLTAILTSNVKAGLAYAPPRRFLSDTEHSEPFEPLPISRNNDNHEYFSGKNGEENERGKRNKISSPKYPLPSLSSLDSEKALLALEIINFVSEMRSMGQML